ncbi:Ligand of Numb protein X 2 [Fasciola gigantica]|uniref:Ligand of Numb protein X 2 n=1 Tax=Fasciola gigantica TaxID=46835 RepID=A0A504YN76_FASGI|nr:Ligand of Numb protein X 2 [Fasciola gigantica]
MINTPRQLMNQNAAHSFVSNSGFVDSRTLVSGVHMLTDPVTTVTATVRPTNAISLPTTAPGLSVVSPTCIPLLIPQVPSSIPSPGPVTAEVDRLASTETETTAIDASKATSNVASNAAITKENSSAFRAIFPQEFASTQCVLSFPDPPKEAFGMHNHFTPVNKNSNMESTLATAATDTISTTISVSAHPSSVQPFPPESQSSQPIPSILCTTKSHEHVITTNPFENPSDLKRTSSILSDNEASEALWCGTCGHVHDLSTAHTYEYSESVDSDLLCRLCRQPLVDPLDTKCGHTFCSSCLKSHLAVQALCPEDKQIINYLECQQSSNLVKRLLDKLLVICPNSEHCREILARCDLESHLAYWCRGAVVACVNNKLGCPYLGLRAKQPAHRWNCQFQPSVPQTITIADAPQISDRVAASTSPQNSPRDQRSSDSGGPRLLGNESSVKSAAPSQSGSHQESTSSAPCSTKETSTEAAQFAVEGQIGSIDLKLDGRSELGISLVGGCDTPLLCMIIQEIYLDGIAARDGRLRPGDQILEVNGEELAHATHLQACLMLSSLTGSVCRLTVYREQAVEAGHSLSSPASQHRIDAKQELLRIVLPKSQEKRLGIKLAGKKNCLGLYVLGLVPDGQAQLDGRLRKDDRILEINGVDLSNGTQEQAAQLIADAKDQVTLVILRQLRPQTPDIIRAASGENVSKCVVFSTSGQQSTVASPAPVRAITCTTAGNPPPPPRGITTLSNVPLEPDVQLAAGARVCQERVLVLTKRPGESLGMSVAGGVASQRGDVPIYVTNLAPNGLVARSGRVFRGDILLAVNDIELLGLSHERAVEALKNARDTCTQVTLRLLKGPECSLEDRNFIPSWLFWLQLPRYCQIPRLVVLVRDPVIGLGFSIIGGNDFFPDANETVTNTTAKETDGSDGTRKTPTPRPIVIKSIVPGSPCYWDGRLKCGDILLSVDHYPLTNISHAHAVALLKHCTGEVKLRIVSWPGTIV